MKNIEKLQSELLESIANTSALSELEDLRISALGKKGEITQLMRDMGNLDPETRRATGQKLNSLKISINPIAKEPFCSPAFISSFLFISIS